jgi:hypothetical protein
LKDHNCLARETDERLDRIDSPGDAETPEDARVRDILQNLHLYHVQDDSDVERIKAR